MNPISKLFSPVKKFFTQQKSSWDRLWLRSLEHTIFGTAVKEAYQDHQTVFMAIDAIADTAPQVNFKTYRGEEGEEIKKHAILSLLDRPNPLMCRFQLWEATIVYLKMRGRCIWVFGKSLGQEAGTSKVPAEIWVFNPDRFEPVKDTRTGMLLGFRYASKIFFGLDEVIYFHKFNPFDTIGGNDLTKKIKRTVDLDYKSMLFNSAFFDNAAVPDGFLSTEGKLNDVQFKRIIEQFEERHKGINKARRVALLEAGLKYQPGAETHRDMEFLEQRKFNREEILGIWRVPKSIFSITDDLNYATAREQKRLFWENAIIPTLTYIQEQLNGFFFPRYAPEIYGEFDYSLVTALMSDYKEKCEMATRLWAMGFTGNEINMRLNLGFEDKPWRDHWWIPFGQAPSEEVQNDPFMMGGSQPAQLPNGTGSQDGKAEDEKWDKMFHIIKTGSRNSKQHREITWQRFDRSIKPIELQFAGKIRNYFFQVRRAVMTEIEKASAFGKLKGIGDLNNVNWQELEQLLIRTSKPYLIQAAERGLMNAAADLGTNVNFEIYNQKILSFLKDKEIKIKRVSNTIRNQVRSIVDEAVTNGTPIQATAKELREMFNFAAKRSITIARTETVGSTNGGQLLFYKESGVTRKQWSTAKDERVRDGSHGTANHQRLDGEIVDIDKNFSNGLDHPGGNGPASEVVNCRCTVLPVV